MIDITSDISVLVIVIIIVIMQALKSPPFGKGVSKLLNLCWSCCRLTFVFGVIAVSNTDTINQCHISLTRLFKNKQAEYPLKSVNAQPPPLYWPYPGDESMYPLVAVETLRLKTNMFPNSFCGSTLPHCLIPIFCNSNGKGGSSQKGLTMGATSVFPSQWTTGNLLNSSLLLLCVLICHGTVNI